MPPKIRVGKRAKDSLDNTSSELKNPWITLRVKSRKRYVKLTIRLKRSVVPLELV